jgi:hypothetical protein
MEDGDMYIDKPCQVISGVEFAGIVKNYFTSTLVAQAVAASSSEFG